MGPRLQVSLPLPALALTSGDILVGADGIHSKVREHVLGSAAPTATYSGLCGIGGTLPLSQIRTPPGYHFPAFIYTSAGMLMAIPLDPEGQTIGWASLETIPDKGREGWAEYHRTGEAARAAKNTYQGVTHEPIRSIMDGIVDDQVNFWAPYELPDLPTWHTKRVCLIGDAAHAIPPYGGQGSAQALEDAGYLARLLESQDAVAKGYDKVFAKFEKVRKDRFQHVRDLTAASGSTRRGSGPGLAWTFRKWATRGYFWFKGGVLRDTRITGYDVQEEDVSVEA
jgi:2-polyprenyl-6-methoxyphenol hydroxylase-like FAD-dependent oxidoreductase